MRNKKLLAMLLTICMVLTIFAGCDGGASAPTTEEPTTTTTAAPTSTPTPTPEPTSTPAPTPVIEKWATDDKLIGTWFCHDDSNIIQSYTFNDDNTGLLVTIMTVTDGETKEQKVRTTVTEIKWSVISEGMVRMSYIFNDKERFTDFEYKFVEQGLQIEYPDASSFKVKIFTNYTYRIYPF